MKKPLVVIGILLICSGALIVLTGTAYTLMLPNIYASMVRIEVFDDSPEGQSHSPQFTGPNPYFLRTQFELISSNPVLYEVIDRLNLQEKWGYNGEKLPRSVALQILRNSVQTFQQRDTALLIISAKRDDPDEAAAIANEIAATYRDLRIGSKKARGKKILSEMERSLRAEELHLAEIEKKARDLRDTLGINEESYDELDPSLQLYRKALSDVKAERAAYTDLNTRFRKTTIEYSLPTRLVEIVDVAEPNRRPVSPNLFMNVLLSAAIGGSISMAGIVMLLLGVRRSRA